jgi:MFS transporter, DHA3 family, macrolide efflux protein
MRVLRPLRGRSMALLWGGLSFSAVGDQLYAVALTWIAVGVLGSNAGYLGAVQAFIGLLAVLSVGIWADRWESTRAMIAADVASAAVLLGVVAAAMLSGRPSVSGLVCAIVVLALGQAVFQPALQSVIPAVIADPAELPAANGLMDATGRIARLLGPGIVALLVSIVPVLQFLTLDAASFLISAAALALIRRANAIPNTPRHSVREPIWGGIIRGYRATGRHRILGYYLVATGPLNGAFYAVYYLCLPLLIARSGNGETSAAGLGAYGLVLSGYGCGNLASTLFFGGRALPARPQFRMLRGNVLTGCGIAALVLASVLPMEWRVAGYTAASALGAMGGPMQDIVTAVQRQTRLAPADRAAAMRAYMAMVRTGVLVAMLFTPVAITLFGVSHVILGCAAVYFCVAAVGLTRLASWRDAGAAPITSSSPVRRSAC